MKFIISLFVSLAFFSGLRGQNVGIGTTTPIARLHVADSNVVFTAPAGIPFTTSYAPPVEGAGARMMWYPQKAAFRVGLVEDFGSTFWDKDSIGRFSYAAGFNTKAKGEAAVAIGSYTSANGRHSVAMGDQSLASGHSSTAMGYYTTASGTTAFASGVNTIASGYGSTAMGFVTTAKARGSFTVGEFNDSTDAPHPNNPNPSDRIFQIGNGPVVSVRKNAMTVLRNGNIGIGITNPRFPFSFSNSYGDKISLYDDGNPSAFHFGLGVNDEQLLQLYTASSSNDIAFGHGNSGWFIETMRIKGNGKVGINTAFPQAFLHVADGSVVFTSAATLPASPGDPAASGAGSRTLWYADKAAFRTGTVTGTQWDKENIGNHSFASGHSSIASGNLSVAMGNGGVASGDFAVSIGSGNVASGLGASAFGISNTASGISSTTMGDNNRASGWFSTVTGRYNKAKGDFSLVTGLYNDTTFTNSRFEIGNGSADNARSNAFTVLSNGSTVITAPSTLPIAGLTPISGNGYRMMWYADKAAFRAGQAMADSWDRDNIGLMSFATGVATRALGIASFAAGNFAYALGSSAVAAGFSVQSKALGSAALGTYNDLTDNPFPSITGPSDRIFQIGNGASNLSRSNAMTILRDGKVGFGTLLPNQELEVVAGPSAAPITLLIGNKGGFGPASLEFVSDYGQSNQWRPGYIRSNDAGGFTGILEFYTNGTGAANLNTSVKGLEVRNGVTYTATGTVSSWSDSRLKKDIQPFTDGLDVIAKISTVSFYYNDLAPFPSANQQIGVIAQDLEKIAPYMVDKTTTKDIDALRSVNNQAYIFLLINSVKELELQNREQQKQIEELKAILNSKK